MKLKKQKNIALVAHDNMKQSIVSWAIKHKKTLQEQNLFATGTTGTLLEKSLSLSLSLSLKKFKSSPLSGDLQIGARIAENEIDMLIFFWDHWNHNHMIQILKHY